MIGELLLEKLDPRSGTVLPHAPETDAAWQTVLDIVWKGQIHFIVDAARFRRSFGHFYVMRDRQFISPDDTFTQTDDLLFRTMQGMIDDIERGKYANKKTLSEKIRTYTDQKGLVPCMNNTKWRELFRAVAEKLPDIELRYKSVFEETAPEEFREYSGDEHLRYMNPAQIEWLQVRPAVTGCRHIGVLVPPEIRVHDKKDEFTQILNQYHIPYAYSEAENVFVIYGYK